MFTSFKPFSLKYALVLSISVISVIYFINFSNWFEIDRICYGVTLSNKVYFSDQTGTNEIEYIFDFEIWHGVLLLGHKIGNMSLCDIPAPVRSIVDAYCQSALQHSCKQLPCVLIHQSNETNKLISYVTNGQISDKNDDINVLPKSQTIQHKKCIKSPALELFQRGPPFPSLVTNGRARFTKELFGDVLSKYFRSPKSIWGLLLDGESITYYPWSGTKSLLSFFDITQGYDRDLYDIASDSYLLHDECYLRNMTRLSFDSVMQLKLDAPSYVTAPIIWMSSNCNPPSNRTEYMKQLMLHMPVDSWGKCGLNKGPQLPAEIKKIQGVDLTGDHYTGNWILAKKALIKNYKFTVAIENSFEHDYVTEKLWQPLAAGSVPLYYGAPNIDDWLPCENCIIDLRKFSTPQEASEFISDVSKNMTKYGEYQKWRDKPLRPQFQKIIDYFKRARTYSLDSVVCAMAHSNNPQLTRYEILSNIGEMFRSD